MATATQTTVVGVFENHGDARQAVDQLKQAGFRNDQIGVVYRDSSGDEFVAEAEDTYAEEGAATGALAGAGIGGLWAIGIAAGALPAIGPVVAGGTLAAILASAAGGAVTGGILGTLVGLGIPEDEARVYEEELHAGRTVVTVNVDGRHNDALNILKRAGAANFRGSTSQIHPRSMDVPLAKEDVFDDERRPAAGRKTPKTSSDKGDEVRIPVKEEQVHPQKGPRATGPSC
jgi:hypothetical protein